MIEKVIEYSVRNPLVIIILALMTAAWGVHAVINTPVDAIPDLSENQVIVFADWMGRSPREVEDQVTYPLSVNLQGLAGVKAIRATSEFGFSMINIIFEDNIDFYFARQRVLERLSIAATFLPQGVTPYLAPDATALGQVFWYTVEGEGYDLGRLRAIQDWFVRYQLYSVPGVAEVASVGGFPIEYQVDVDPNKLRAYGVTLGELYSAVAKANSSVGGRILQKAGAEYLIRSVGWIESPADVERIVIKSASGTPVYVSNVATVQMGSALRRASLEKNGNEAVGGVVLMRYGENPLRITERIKEKIAQLQDGLPPGVRIVPFYDRTRLIQEAIDTVTGTLKEEMFVASLAILLILWHLRSALIVCIMLPMAVLVAFLFMRLFGIPSNIMSLSGIAISIGVLVDSSIVMVENATHHLYGRFGKETVRGDTRELVLPALRTVGRPIFFSVMVMVISFLPVFALGGMEGRMFHPLAFTKTFAMVGVAILAVTLVPALVPLLVKGRLRSEEESWIVRSVLEIYRPVLRFLLDHPWPIVLATGWIFLAGAAPIGLGGLFQTVLASALVATIWSAGRDEDGFRRYWKTMAGVWLLALPLLAQFGPREMVLQWLEERFAADSAEPLRTGPAGTVLWWLACLGLGIPLVAIVSGLLAWGRCLGRVTLAAGTIVFALAMQQQLKPLGREFMPPLDEGTILDMPVTIPRASITQAADDLKARDAVLRSFPEVSLVVGKAGRAETPTDPAPPDMVETVVNLRPRSQWPKRALRFDDAMAHAAGALDEMVARGWLEEISASDRSGLINDAVMFAISKFDQTMRDHTLLRFTEFERELAPVLVEFGVDRTAQLLSESNRLLRPVEAEERRAMAEALAPALGPILVSAPDLPTMRRLAEQVAERLAEIGAVERRPDLLVLERSPVRQLLSDVGEVLGTRKATFFTELLAAVEQESERRWAERLKSLDWELYDLAARTFSWHALAELKALAADRGFWQGEVGDDELHRVREVLEGAFARNFFLWQKPKDELLKEMDSVVSMPGWGNIWTQPIINRVDMLATGVRTMIGVKVFGNDLDTIQKVASEVAEALKQVRGAVDVIADQIVGEGYLEIDIDRARAARYGVNVGDVQEVVETALGGRIITMTVEGRERFPVRIRYARDFRVDEESVKNLLVNAGAGGMAGAAMPGDMKATAGMGKAMPAQPATDRAEDGSAPLQVPLSLVADVRIVEGPSMIKSENGLLRFYVQCNVRDRDIVGFVEEAQRVIAENVKLPPNMYIEWSGQFEHQLRAKRTLSVIVPLVILVIFVILFVTYNDLSDALLMMLAVPGAVAGGILFQCLFGFNFSVAVWVGFIACFGLATETGVVMLVYLREAVEKRGGLAKLTLPELRDAIMEGAVHRLRPKLLTEGTTIVGLAPMLWATGTGAEIMQPMAAPVLGGILVADEVIDLLLPVLFYLVRRRRWHRLHQDRPPAQPTAAPVVADA